MMSPKFVVANWKMNTTFQGGVQLARDIIQKLDNQGLQDVQIILAPPFIHLPTIHQLVLPHKRIFLCAQNCYADDFGAFTGEISAPMLHSVGVTYVILGHSERRCYFNEDNVLLARKITKALAHHLHPIFCCGESLAIREADQHIPYVVNQLQESLFPLTAQQLAKVIIAYEPIWAIGTGCLPSSSQITTMHTAIHDTLAQKYGSELAAKISILYGGSCNQDNAKNIFSCVHVAGGLIGGASLQVDNFINIVNAFN